MVFLGLETSAIAVASPLLPWIGIGFSVPALFQALTAQGQVVDVHATDRVIIVIAFVLALVLGLVAIAVGIAIAFAFVVVIITVVLETVPEITRTVRIITIGTCK